MLSSRIAWRMQGETGIEGAAAADPVPRPGDVMRGRRRFPYATRAVRLPKEDSHGNADGDRVSNGGRGRPRPGDAGAVPEAEAHRGAGRGGGQLATGENAPTDPAGSQYGRRRGAWWDVLGDALRPHPPDPA